MLTAIPQRLPGGVIRLFVVVAQVVLEQQTSDKGRGTLNPLNPGRLIPSTADGLLAL
jgi:hypothetical protein